MNEQTERMTMSVEEAAKELGVNSKMVYTLIHQQDFPVAWLGRRARINREGLSIWLDKHTQGMEELLDWLGKHTQSTKEETP